MKSGYHKIEILEAHNERTAFTVGPMGFYKYNRMPFGMINSPAKYQRLRKECLADYNLADYNIHAVCSSTTSSSSARPLKSI